MDLREKDLEGEGRQVKVEEDNSSIRALDDFCCQAHNSIVKPLRFERKSLREKKLVSNLSQDNQRAVFSPLSADKKPRDWYRPLLEVVEHCAGESTWMGHCRDRPGLRRFDN